VHEEWLLHPPPPPFSKKGGGILRLGYNRERKLKENSVNTAPRNMKQDSGEGGRGCVLEGWHGVEGCRIKRGEWRILKLLFINMECLSVLAVPAVWAVVCLGRDSDFSETIS